MILYIGNKLSKHGYTPTCIETLGPQLESIYKIKTISSKKNKLLRLLDIILNIILNRKNTKLILIDTYSTSNFYFALISAFFAKKFHIPYIPILHGGSLPSRLKKSPNFCNFLFKNATINVSPSKYLEEVFIENNFNVVYIPNNIDLSIYPFKLRNQIKPKLLYVRAFHKIYNPLMAIEVLNKLLLQFPDATLCMVGPDKDGTKKDVQDLVSKYNIVNSVKITGKLNKKDWIELSKEYDIFINTTNFDNQPVSIIEAMSLGFPIISTNAGGMPYLINNNHDGIIVEKNAITEMTDSIIHLLKNKEIASKLSKNARKTSEDFNWENVKEKWNIIITKHLRIKND